MPADQQNSGSRPITHGQSRPADMQSGAVHDSTPRPLYDDLMRRSVVEWPSAAETIREAVKRRTDADVEAREAEARANLGERIQRAVMAALDGAPQIEKGAVDVVSRWAADAAVEVFVDYLRNPPVREVQSDGTEVIRYEGQTRPDEYEGPGWAALTTVGPADLRCPSCSAAIPAPTYTTSGAGEIQVHGDGYIKCPSCDAQLRLETRIRR